MPVSNENYATHVTYESHPSSKEVGKKVSRWVSAFVAKRSTWEDDVLVLEGDKADSADECYVQLALAVDHGRPE